MKRPGSFIVLLALKAIDSIWYPNLLFIFNMKSRSLNCWPWHNRISGTFFLPILISRCRYEGVSPPVARSSGDFDPAAHFYVTGSIPLIR